MTQIDYGNMYITLCAYLSFIIFLASFCFLFQCQVLQLQMNDYQYHYLFASPVINQEIVGGVVHSWLKVISFVIKDLETFDLEDFKYNFVNISAFRIVDADSNITRHLLRDMEKFQPIGQSILNKSNIIQVVLAVYFSTLPETQTRKDVYGR